MALRGIFFLVLAGLLIFFLSTRRGNEVSEVPAQTPKEGHLVGALPEKRTINPPEKAAEGQKVDWKRYQVLQAKAVLTEHELREKDQLLSSPLWLADVESIISPRAPLASESRRFQALAYLESALAWEENPARETILSFLDGFLLKPIPEGDLEFRRAVAGDKVDLYLLIAREAGTRAESIRTRAEGPIRALLDYARSQS